MYLPPFQNIEQFTQDPTLKAIRPWWMVLLGAAILYLVPAQTIAGMPVLGVVIEWFASIVPSIARWVQLSPFPHNTKLFAVFVWLMIPLQVYWLVRSRESKRFFQASYLSKTAQQPVLIRLVALLSFFAFFVSFVLLAFNFAIIDTPPCRVCVNSSRWAQLFIGGVYSLGLSGLIAFFLLSLPLFFNALASKGKN